MRQVQHCPCRLYQEVIREDGYVVAGMCIVPCAEPSRDPDGTVRLNADRKEIYDVCGKPLGAHPNREGD